MVKNNKGGKGNRRRGRKFTRPMQRGLIEKESGQDYGKLIRNLGDHRFECLGADGVTRIAHIPGSFQNRIWMRVDDIILYSLRIGFSNNLCDICYKYNPNEVLQLEEKGVIKRLLQEPTELPIENLDDVEIKEDTNKIDIDECLPETETTDFFDLL